MSHSRPTRPTASASRRTNAPRSTAPRSAASRSTAPRSTPSRGNATQRTSPVATPRKTGRKNKGLPLPMKRLIRWIFSKNNDPKNNGHKNNGHKNNKQPDSNYPRKVWVASGSVTALALLAIVPMRVASEAIADSACQQVIKSGAEISRKQLSDLATVPEGTAQAAVRQVVNEPYCLLPVNELEKTASEKAAPESAASAQTADNPITREAYPLAFDPEAWIVVNYDSGEYTGYDFVFKP